MKSHISVTIEASLLTELDRHTIRERRSRSQIIELALEEFLQKQAGSNEQIVTSAGRFAGRFNRDETYAR